MTIEAKSVCRGCHGGCAATLTVDNGRLIKVRPAEGSPFNMGQMCPKGIFATQLVNHPDRLTLPLKRTGKRGGGQWKKITWEQALGEIADSISSIRDKFGAESIAIGQGTGRHHYLHTVRFANSLGTPNWYEPGLANCFIPRITVSNLTYGGFVSADYYSGTMPRTIMFWGQNPLVSGPDGKLSFPVEAALDNGSFGICIDPRKTLTAQKCQIWLPIRPGTDAALALAMINHIISHELYDRQFVEKWTFGFDELTRHVQGFSTRWAEKICGVKAVDIETAARIYAEENPSSIEWGVAIEQHPNSLQTARAIAILRGLTGNIDRPGSDLLGMNILRPYPTLRDKLPKGMIKKRLGADKFKLLGGFRAFMPSAHIPAVFEAMRSDNPYPVKALLLFGNNPLVSVANPEGVYKAFHKLNLLVATDLFMTPSAALADYVLPASAWPEVDQIVEMPYVTENAVCAQQKLIQTGECKPDEQIMIELARKLQLPDCDTSLRQILDYRLEPLGIDFDGLKERFMVYPPHKFEKFKEKGFRTPSRKIELYSKALAKLGYDPLPTFKEPPESPESRPDLIDEYPYILITGARSRVFFCSEGRQIPALRSRHKEPLAQIHPEIAQAKGIENGDRVIVRSPRGQIEMSASVNDQMRKDVVSIDFGWWFPELQTPDKGVWQSNANLLTSDKPPYDPAFGSYQLRALLCNIEMKQ